MFEGWQFLENWAKAHYVKEKRTLCGKWLSFEQTGPIAPIKEESCAACWKKAGKL